jgi:enoyl-CoA hydratase
MTTEPVLVLRDGPIVTLTLNRADRRNALDSSLIGALTALVSSLTSEALATPVQEPETARVIVLTGAGDKAFAAGADIRELGTLDATQAEALSAAGARLTLLMEQSPLVIIAAVNGHALGGGCELALAADFIYASERAVFGFPEVGLGVMPGFGGTQRLPRRIALGVARELLFSGALVNAERARELGLANAVVPHEELLGKATDVARLIAAKAPLGVAATKRAVRRGMDVDLESALALESKEFGALFATEDAREGLAAFLAKRPPSFGGR